MPQPVQDSKMNLGKAAAVLGIIQAVIWMILAIVGIIQHFVGEPNLGFSHSDVLQLFLLFAIQVKSSILVIDGIGLLVIMIIYLSLSASWLYSSISLYMGLKRNQLGKLKNFYTTWAVLAFLTSIYDVVVVGLLASNYTKFDTNILNVYYLLTYGILFSLAARGYVLWVINFSMAVLMYKQAQSFSVKNSASSPIPPLDNGRNYGHQGYGNRGWEEDNTHNLNRPSHSTSPGGLPRAHVDSNVGLNRQGPTKVPPSVAPKPNYIYPSPQNMPTAPTRPPTQNYSPPPPPMFNRNNNRY